MAYIAQNPAIKAQTELSSTHVHGPAQRGITNVNALLVSQTLIAAAKHKAGIVVPRPSAPMTMYSNPDGTVCTSRSEALAFDKQGYNS